MPHPYTCPTIPQGLRKEETYVQIAEALNYLSDVSEDVFRRVNNRISSNSDKLRLISERIQAARQKIQRISAAKHAVQIFSSSKYPAAAMDERAYESLFSTTSSLPIKRFNYRYKPVAQALDEPVEKLEIYHEPAVGDTLVRLEGLGNVPNDTNFVGDLLFYNSGKNAYAHSMSIGDPLERAGGASSLRQYEQMNAESHLGDAPQSIADKNLDPLNQMRADSYFYFPDIGNVPSLDVPLDLPDLPGIADDVHYITDKELSIAPSLLHGHSKLTRNHTSETTTKQPDPSAIIEASKTNPDETITTKTTDSTFMNSTVKDDRKKVDRVEELPDSLPDISDISADMGDGISGALPKPVFTPVDDPHATLMEAIRKAAGGRNLRSAQVVDASCTNSGDLMTDLHAKLLMRRKGISGSKVSGTGESLSVMDKISGMIPPPTNTTAANDTPSETVTTEDEDWED